MSMKTSLLLLGLALIQEGAAIRPVVTFTPDYRKIFIGEKITMTCDVGSIGEELRYRWYKDEIYVYNGKSYTIQAAERSQSGSYQCETSNGERSDPVTLDVISVGWVILQIPLYVYEGDDIKIRCHHKSGYKGGRTRFYKDNRIIRDWTYNEEYYIGNVDRKTTGKYKCGKEVYPSRWYQDKAYVSVKDLFSPPVLTVSPELVIDGDTMTLSCDTNLSDYRQDTDLQYAFYRDGRTVQGFTSSNKYQVLFIQKENSGNYTCEIRTPTSGVKKESQRLHIQGSRGSSIMPILSVSLGLLLLIIIFTLLCVAYQCRSSENNPQPTTAADNDYSTQVELNYTVLDPTRRPRADLPQDNGSNVVYAEVNSKAKHQVKASHGTSDTSADIYQNISSY
ncbi:high affinity immunoglobulin gamma Fc receptor I-like isoform X2 [Hyla sarda]|uniref:high affinity immunoglobulin gamma Fc receptor I-like isoform X2 n=1 Tax=Hyla sarda TaxID=327740 RepID=UPI0024C234BB|nr:high affinity immunoglobulin gamma Fc receptor I-like isoform X2 [Hyla sarda]XP_056401378.1 high affinity immunoglobulin gamma Fc receptor I-like isoform X2 [Hyla sarda]XP_056401379.1 high affinity immunoglobulin gamma Fc receptor I-like isoform X2 [Hyla sarda]